MNEQISALIDDEVSAEDIAYAVNVIQSNLQGLDSWRQYNLIGDVMRDVSSFKNQELATYGLGLDFKQKLMSKLELEPTVLSPNAALMNLNVHESSSHRKVPVVWSIAASFAAFMVVGWMALHQLTQSEPYSSNLAQVETKDQGIPQEYLAAHQNTAPSASSYYIQTVSYSE